MNHLTELYVELFKRKQFDKIPVFKDDTGYYYLSKPQIRALELIFDGDTFFIGYGGSGMSGKSQLMCFALTFLCLSYENTRWLLGRKELKNLKATTVKTLHKTFEFYGLKRYEDYNYNDQSHDYTFFNNSMILLKDTAYKPSDEEFTELGGLELTAAFLDESAENVKKVVNILTSRVNRWNNLQHGIKAFIFEGFNPLKNHVHERFWIPYKKGEELYHTKFIRALSSDNPHPDARIWEKNILKTGDKRTIERLLNGNFDYDDDENSLINYDKIMDMFTNTFVEDGERFISSDIAITNDSFVCVVWSGLKIIEISSIKNVSKPLSILTDSGEWINKVDFTPLINEFDRLTNKYRIGRSNIVYDADGIGHKLRTFLSGAIGLNNNARPTDPAYYNLKSQLYYLFAELVNSNEVFIQADLNTDIKDRLIKEIGAIKRSSDIGEKLKIMPKSQVKMILGHSPDLTDAIVYRLLFWITRKK